MISGLLRRLNLLRQLLPTAATTVTMTATATAATMARTAAATAAPTAATTQPQKRGCPKGSKDKELRKRRQKATGGGDTTATGIYAYCT